MVFYSSWCSNNDLWTRAQFSDFVRHRLSSIKKTNIYCSFKRKRSNFFCHLNSKFSCRSENDCLSKRFFLINKLKKRNCKRSGFSCSSLCLPDNIFFSSKKKRNNLFLYWTWFFKSFLLYRT